MLLNCMFHLSDVLRQAAVLYLGQNVCGEHPQYDSHLSVTILHYYKDVIDGG